MFLRIILNVLSLPFLLMLLMVFAEVNYAMVYDTTVTEISGAKAERAAPWHILIEAESTGKYLCSGSAANSKWILTTAACTLSSTSLTARMGMTSILIGGSTREVQLIMQHPKFDSETLENNVGMLRVTPPFNEQGTKDLLLPEPTLNLPQSGYTLSGFGDIRSESKNDLYLDQITIITYENCNSQYESKCEIPKNSLCVAWDKKKIFVGDYGAPLAHKTIQIGVMINTSNKETADCPFFFLDLRAYLTWIVEITTAYRGNRLWHAQKKALLSGISMNEAKQGKILNNFNRYVKN